ncbi:hypothetical protein KR222_001417 [Zaprionus bogoriensis]|nr:hypothetical protein KR222_001417 [Zaprionus bogoriensis]
MVDLTRCLLVYAYLYGRFVGVINFEIDLRTGRARYTRFATVYSALSNGLSIGLAPWLATGDLIHTFWSHAGFLHEYLLIVILSGRILCVYFTIFTRWRQREQFVRLVNIFRLLMLQKPLVKRLCRRGIISKVISITLSELFQMVLGIIILWDKLSVAVFIGTLFFYTLNALVNVIISHYYFALLNIHGHYILLNEELRLVLNEAWLLETERRRGVSILKCCALADRLEVVAQSQYLLQQLLENISHLFGIQIICMTLSYYLSSISVIYLAFSEFRGTSIILNRNQFALAVICLEFICYFVDIHITVNVIYALLDAHAEMVRLLSEHTILAPGLDQRLETVFETFQLQLARNPFKITVLGLYKVEREKAIAMASSIVTNSIVLIQYEMKNG